MLVSTTDVELDVSIPIAQSIGVTSSVPNNVLACSTDLAAKQGVGYPSTAQLTVQLNFPEKVVVQGLEVDPLTTFAVPTELVGSIKIDPKTGLMTALCKPAKGSITVTYTGQNVTANVLVEVVGYADIILSARPWPRYGVTKAGHGARSVKIIRVASG
jgi:hypothetical protein